MADVELVVVLLIAALVALRPRRMAPGIAPVPAPAAWSPFHVHRGARIGAVTQHGHDLHIYLDRPNAPVGIVLERYFQRPAEHFAQLEGGTLGAVTAYPSGSGRCLLIPPDGDSRRYLTVTGELIRWATNDEIVRHNTPDTDRAECQHQQMADRHPHE